MRALLVHIDGKLPNLALMKLAAWHRRQDDEVGFRINNPDRVYISCIFPQNAPHARGVALWYPDIDVRFGGPGFEKPSYLPKEVEHTRPWYKLYNIDYDMGYTTRGCPWRCPFCYVPMLEGAFTEHADIAEFHEPGHQRILLMDNNFLYSTRWEETLDFINRRKMRVNFNQGLDFRFLTHEKATVLAKTRLYPSSFKKPGVTFAWDLMENEEFVKRGIRILREGGMAMYKVQVYVLVGFNTTIEQDLYRVYKIVEWGLDPFVMVYNNRRDNQKLLDLARWANRHLYSVCPDFKDYDSRL